jgi:hypothetical protein
LSLICNKQLRAGGGQGCNPLSVQSFSSLLLNAGACDQQNAADRQIDLAKTLGNDPTMIRLTQIFVQQPRNSVCFPSSFANIVLIKRCPFGNSPTLSVFPTAKTRHATRSSTVFSNANSKG